MAKVVTLTTTEIDSKLLHEPGPFALDFYQASWAPCRALASQLERVAQTYAGQLPVYRVDIDHDLWVAQRFDVMSIPTVLIVRAGKEVERIDGLIRDVDLQGGVRPGDPCLIA